MRSLSWDKNGQPGAELLFLTVRYLVLIHKADTNTSKIMGSTVIIKNYWPEILCCKLIKDGNKEDQKSELKSKDVK
jgi:hypothetical protein